MNLEWTAYGALGTALAPFVLYGLIKLISHAWHRAKMDVMLNTCNKQLEDHDGKS